MPARKLPPELVRRLEKTEPVINRLMHQMKNIDSRMDRKLSENRTNIIETDPRKREIMRRHALSTFEWGGRVREMNVSRNFPGTKLVIKRTHSETPGGEPVSAKETIDAVKGAVEKYNKGKTNGNSTLLMPQAYAIGKDLIAMAKINAPSLEEVIEGERQTKRGREFFENLQKRNKTITNELLENTAQDVCLDTGLIRSNILLLGVKKGKFVFMPLVDEY